MLYLIENENLYKIGYTTNIKSRMSTYKTHNPECVLINTIEGTSNDEKNLHKLCEEYKHSKEWFYKNDNILELFNNYKTIEWNQWDEVKSIINTIMNNIENKVNDFNTDHWLTKVDYNTYSKLSKFFSNVSSLTKPDDYQNYFNKWNFVKNFYYNISKEKYIELLHEYNIVSNEKIVKLVKMNIDNLKYKLEKQINECNIIIAKAQTAMYEAQKEKMELEKDYNNLNENIDNIINMYEKEYSF